MDERPDLQRSVRDERYLFIRSYMPHRPEGQHVAYMFETPTTVAWKALHDAGALSSAQAAFWGRKPLRALFDLHRDPDEVVDVAADPAHRATLERLEAALLAHELSW